MKTSSKHSSTTHRGAYYADKKTESRTQSRPSGAHYAPKHSWAESIFAGDKALWVVIVMLLIYSLFVVYSTTAYDPALNANQELTKQLLFIGLGMIGFFTMQAIHPQTYRPFIKIIYWASIILTVLMIVMHKGSNAARSINIAGFDFQPFELLKISVILLLADRLARRQKNIDKIDLLPSFKPKDWKENPEKQKLTLLNHTLPVLGPIALACCITIIISNSTTFIIAISCLLVLFLGRIKGSDIKKIFRLGFVVGIPVILIIGGRLNTAEGRLAGYSPWVLKKSAQVESDGKEYYVRPAHELDQTMYAKMSIASGGLTGKGPGQSTNRYLQEADKDMAYAFLIEEHGLLFGGIVVLLAFLIMFYRGIEIFKKCDTAFPGLSVLGVITAIVLQAFLHMMVSVSLLPVTGQQLPIVSKGGSSLVFTLISLGLVMGISARANNGTLNKKGN
ncbi:MAG: FtsW/RodA/SpoVE family cell cycle protein [Tidjanibacter sp.]|nr:FtsW/RodA/SpoVE family cell cycle protein [Tidjanibacter sp.]